MSFSTLTERAMRASDTAIGGQLAHLAPDDHRGLTADPSGDLPRDRFQDGAGNEPSLFDGAAASADPAGGDAEGPAALPNTGFTPPDGLTQIRFYEEASADKTWLVAEGTGGDDQIVMRQLESGDLQLEINGETVDIPAEHRFDLVVRGGDGDDRIEVDDSVTGRPIEDSFIGRASIVYEGNAGNDTLIGGENAPDTLVGGDGDDVIDGRGGDDYAAGGNGSDVIDGGAGRDVLYGDSGDDVIRGGGDRDYVDGGRGHDEIFGGGGNDTLAGGRGNDRVFGEGGVDTLLGNSSDASTTFTAADGTTRSGDVLDGGDGGDRMIYGPNTQIVADAADAEAIQVDPQALGTSGQRLGEASLDVQGSDAFVERIEDDLEVLRSTETGQRLLEAMDATGEVLRVVESENSHKITDQNTRGTPYYAEIRMDPERYDLNAVGTPVQGPEEHFLTATSVFLHHEIFHGWDFASGNIGETSAERTNSTKNLEFRAVGLPYDQNGDGIPTPAPLHEMVLSENALRAELGLPFRGAYERPQDLRGFDGDALAPFRDQELPGVNPPEYAAPFTFVEPAAAESAPAAP
ncbi:MAG: M91 family zinc metallopeptidase [Acidobacteriota bacterium]